MTDQTLATPKYTFEAILNSDKFKRSLSVMQKDATPERLVQVALNALNRNPELRECTQESFFAAFRRLTEIGLEPDGYHAHLIPFNNKVKGTNPPQWRKEVQLIVDYKGLVTVIRRNPLIGVVKGAVVRDGDEFIYEEGSERIFRHRPMFKQTDKILGAYSFVRFKSGDWEVDYIPKWRIDEVRERSKAKDRGPWVNDYDEMALKTALRHHSKTLPLSSEERAVIQADDDQFEFDPFRKPPLPVRPAQIAAGKREEDPEPNVAHTDPEPPKEESKQTPVSEAKASHGEDPPPELQLERLATANNIEQQEVISALIEHKVPVEDASETGALVDLPQGSILAAIHSWQKIVFTVNKQRLAKGGKK